MGILRGSSAVVQLHRLRPAGGLIQQGTQPHRGRLPGLAGQGPGPGPLLGGRTEPPCGGAGRGNHPGLRGRFRPDRRPQAAGPPAWDRARPGSGTARGFPLGAFPPPQTMGFLRSDNDYLNAQALSAPPAGQNRPHPPGLRSAGPASGRTVPGRTPAWYAGDEDWDEEEDWAD